MKRGILNVKMIHGVLAYVLAVSLTGVTPFMCESIIESVAHNVGSTLQTLLRLR